MESKTWRQHSTYIGRLCEDLRSGFNHISSTCSPETWPFHDSGPTLLFLHSNFSTSINNYQPSTLNSILFKMEHDWIFQMYCLQLHVETSETFVSATPNEIPQSLLPSFLETEGKKPSQLRPRRRRRPIWWRWWSPGRIDNKGELLGTILCLNHPKIAQAIVCRPFQKHVWDE